MKITNLCLFLFLAVISAGCGKKNNETKPERKNITETVFASGTLEPENKYNLTAQTEGYITELKFDDGDLVQTGEVLATIDNKSNVISASSAETLLNLAEVNASVNGPTLSQAIQNTKLLREKSSQDSLQYQRYLRLLQSNSVSKLEVENARLIDQTSRTNYLNAEQNLRLLKQQTEQQLIQQKSQRDINSISNDYNALKAVLGGRIYKRLKETGDYVRRGDVIAVIGSVNELYARLNIDESNIANIRVGQRADIRLNSNKDSVYPGYVSEILPAFEDISQSFICKVKFKRGPELKISGTQLQANIIIGTKNNVLVIPRNYLDYGNKVNVKGKSDPVVVKTGFISSEWVEITGGLSESDVLINLNK